MLLSFDSNRYCLPEFASEGFIPVFNFQLELKKPGIRPDSLSVTYKYHPI